MARHIAPEEEWLRLLVVELQPIMEHLQDTDLPPSKMHETNGTLLSFTENVCL